MSTLIKTITAHRWGICPVCCEYINKGDIIHQLPKAMAVYHTKTDRINYWSWIHDGCVWFIENNSFPHVPAHSTWQRIHSYD